MPKRGAFREHSSCNVSPIREAGAWRCPAACLRQFRVRGREPVKSCGQSLRALASAGGDFRNPEPGHVVVSWNELQRTCQKAFRALGVPAGADDDASFAVLWLEARGLGALTPLEAALAALENAPPRRLGLRRGDGADGVDVLDAGGRNAVSVASDAVDFAIARAFESGTRAEILLTGVEGAIFVAGTLAQRPAPERRAAVQWWDGTMRRRLDVTPDREVGPCATLAKTTVRDARHPLDTVRIMIDEPAGHEWATERTSWSMDVDEAELGRRAMHSVTRGIHVPYPLWTRLLAFAKRTLVPATHASRERGAGGGEYND